MSQCFGYIRLIIGVALITHVTRVYNLRKRIIHNYGTLTKIFCFFYVGTALKEKNLLLLVVFCHDFS